MFHLHQLLYNTIWYYTMVSESCIGFFQNLRNQCGCTKKVTDISLEETCDSIVFKKHKIHQIQLHIILLSKKMFFI